MGAVDVPVVSSSTHGGYVYKERLKIITSESEANKVSEFFVKNLQKENLLFTYVENHVFDDYALLTGYVNVSFLDQSITVVNVVKEDNKITVQLSSDFNRVAQSLTNQANLSYVFFIVKVDKESVDASTVLDVAFLSEDPNDQKSTYPFVNQTGFTSDTAIENIDEFTELSYEGPIIQANSVESFHAIVSSIADSADLDELSHDETFFDTHSYIFANYTYSGSESVVCIMGIEKEGTDLQLVFSGNAPESLEPMQQKKRSKLFVIDVLKANIAGITSFSYNNYNLFNGDHRTVLNNNTISDSYELVSFERMDSQFGVSIPLNICRISSMQELTETIQAWHQYSDVSYLNDCIPEDDFFADNQMILLPITYRSSDIDLQVSEIRNYGNYYEIIASTNNTKFDDQTYGIYNSVFILSIPKSQLTDDAVFVYSMIYLKDQVTSILGKKDNQ
jgi:hypothetical protein